MLRGIGEPARDRSRAVPVDQHGQGLHEEPLPQTRRGHPPGRRAACPGAEADLSHGWGRLGTLTRRTSWLWSHSRVSKPRRAAWSRISTRSAVRFLPATTSTGPNRRPMSAVTLAGGLPRISSRHGARGAGGSVRGGSVLRVHGASSVDDRCPPRCQHRRRGVTTLDRSHPGGMTVPSRSPGCIPAGGGAPPPASPRCSFPKPPTVGAPGERSGL